MVAAGTPVESDFRPRYIDEALRIAVAACAGAGSHAAGEDQYRECRNMLDAGLAEPLSVRIEAAYRSLNLDRA
jgi:hypothetical protein